MIRWNILYAITILAVLVIFLIMFTDIQTDVLIAISSTAVGAIATTLTKLADPDDKPLDIAKKALKIGGGKDDNPTPCNRECCKEEEA